MPCCTCTTGSPARSSDRSRSIPSTELTALRSRAARERAVQGIGSAPLHRELGKRGSLSRFDVGSGETFGANEKLLGAQENLRGREQRPRAVAGEQLVAAVRVSRELGKGVVHFPMHVDRG